MSGYDREAPIPAEMRDSAAAESAEAGRKTRVGKVLVFTPGVFDEGGISRNDRLQTQALRERYGTRSTRVLSELWPDEHSFQEAIEVTRSGSPNPGLATKFSLEALRWASRDRPDIALTEYVNLGFLGRVVASRANGLLVQNTYGTEVWTCLWGRRKTALQQAHAVISDCHNTVDLAVQTGLRRQKPAVPWDCVDTERYAPGTPNPVGMTHHSRLARQGA